MEKILGLVQVITALYCVAHIFIYICNKACETSGFSDYGRPIPRSEWLEIHSVVLRRIIISAIILAATFAF